MSRRLVRLAKAIAVIDVTEVPELDRVGGPGSTWGEDEFLEYGCSNEQHGKDIDLKTEDLANRLDEAVTAICDCVAILKELGMAGDKAEEKILSVIQSEVQGPEAIPGGLAKGKADSDFDSEQIEKGIKVELEHTGDREKAREIAKDHLMEIPDYYDRLEKMEREADKGEKTKPDKT